MQNRLANESSPYLLQHKDNPVDWYAWGPEPLERARSENKPIFLSIGYSTCHWCHVMERESFCDERVAKILKDHFISIKLDREERPDLDHVYMSALQMMTGQGGWPLTIFLTPDLKPFFGGTYFAPDARYGRPPFRDVLLRVAATFQEQRDLVAKNALQVAHLLAQESQFFDRVDEIDDQLENKVLLNIKAQIDAEEGGLGTAPKFFHVDAFRLLIRESRRFKGHEESFDLSYRSYLKMAAGGIFDQLEGGFHRYSTDRAWKVPHFEKMLYDNALMLLWGAELLELRTCARVERVLKKTVEWIRREMTASDGGFFSAIDADSDHEEGLFYTWSLDEWAQVLGAGGHSIEQQQELARLFRFDDEGAVLEGRRVLVTKEALSLAEEESLLGALESLKRARMQRTRPLTDTKIQASWNGLMISALARASTVVGIEDWRAMAERAANRLWTLHNTDKGGLWHLADSRQAFSFLEDSAYGALGFLDLAQSMKGEASQLWLDRARVTVDRLIKTFSDETQGGFWFTAESVSDLLVRYKTVRDGALPSAYAVAIEALYKLAALTHEATYKERADNAFKAVGKTALDSPGGFHRLVLALQSRS